MKILLFINWFLTYLWLPLGMGVGQPKRITIKRAFMLAGFGYMVGKLNHETLSKKILVFVNPIGCINSLCLKYMIWIHDKTGEALPSSGDC